MQKSEGEGQQLPPDRPGHAASNPLNIPPSGWWHVLKRAGAGFLEDRIMTEAASVTFFSLLALFPALAALISVYGLFANPANLNKQVSALSGLLPGGGVQIIKSQVSALSSNSQGTLGFAAIISILISLWSANAGVKSLFTALNVVYHEDEKRSFVRFTLVSLAFTLGAIAFAILALGAIVAIPIMLNYVGFGSFGSQLINIARWPAMLVAITVALAFVYRYGPSRRDARWQWVNWGSLVAALCWLAVSFLFSFYVAHFGRYNATYGSLGAVAGFMTWIWLSTIVVLMGGELNADLEQQTYKDSTVGPDKPMGERGAYKADVKE